MVELTTAPLVAEIHDNDIFLIRVEGTPGARRVTGAAIKAFASMLPAFAGQEGKSLFVGEDGLEWRVPLSVLPPVADNAGKVLTVNPEETAAFWAETAASLPAIEDHEGHALFVKADGTGLEWKAVGGGDGFTHVLLADQAAYDAIDPKDLNTIYMIPE